MEEQRRGAIRSAFYVDQLILGQGPQMTATEVVQRTEEKMRLLGPVLGRLQAELLQPMIERCYNLLVKQRAFDAAPEFMADSSIEIEYVSPLAKAQRQGNVQSAMQLIEMVAPLMQLDQGVADYLDTDGLVQHIIRALSVPASVVRGEEEIFNIRQERVEQQNAMQQMQEAQMLAQAAGDAAPAVKAVS